VKYIRTPEHIENLRLARANSLKVRAHIATMNAAKKGIRLSEEHKIKIGQAGIGRIKSVETRAKIGAIHRGKIVSEETRRKQSIARKGKPHPKEDNSSSWRGDKVGYRQLHSWVAKHKKRTGVCLFCGNVGKTYFANISREYLRDLDDFMELCISCHHKYDDIARKIWEARRRKLND
jgi:hypothetical protein